MKMQTASFSLISFLALAACEPLAVVVGGSGLTPGETRRDGGAADVGFPAACNRDACGPMPGAPSLTCADGTIHGWECTQNGGMCGWSRAECDIMHPCDCGPMPGAPSLTCADGTIHGWECIQNGAMCGWSRAECDIMHPCDCGPRPGAPALTCADGSIHDWECVHSNSMCGWSQAPC